MNLFVMLFVCALLLVTSPFPKKERKEKKKKHFHCPLSTLENKYTIQPSRRWLSSRSGEGDSEGKEFLCVEEVEWIELNFHENSQINPHRNSDNVWIVRASAIKCLKFSIFDTKFLLLFFAAVMNQQNIFETWIA